MNVAGIRIRRQNLPESISKLVIFGFMIWLLYHILKSGRKHVTLARRGAGHYDSGDEMWVFDMKNINYKNLLSTGSPPYLEHFKNPCWPTSSSNLECLPYFYIIGFQKCGTTDLFLRLCAHPHIKKGYKKETFWWNSGFFERTGEQYPSPLNFTETFGRVTKDIHTQCHNSTSKCQIIIGEATADTVIIGNDKWRMIPDNEGLDEPTKIIGNLIHHVTPNSKIIVMVRNPIDRLYSDYMYYNPEEPKSKEIFHERVMKSIQTMTTCIKERSVRYCLYNTNIHEMLPVRLHVGMYSEYILDWMKVFPYQQILVLRLEDFMTDYRESMDSVFMHLEMDPPGNDYYQYIKLWSILNGRKQSSSDTMLTSTVKALKDYYMPYNTKLANLLHNDKFRYII